MISIIVSSYREELYKDLTKNIAETIGDIDFELIKIDNPGKIGICEAYNIGAAKSKFNYLLFLHEDVLFRTIGWGEIIKKTFENNKDLGLLGIAGSSIKTKMPSTWWTGPGLNYIRIVQHDKANSKFFDKNEGFNEKSFVEVAAIDGVLMIMKKDERIRFDENLKGYHNYDLDLSLKHYCLNKKVGATNELLIEHFSGGKIDRDWYLSTSIFHKKNRDKLPIIKSEISANRLKNAEFTTGAIFVMGLLDNNLNSEALYWWLKLLNMKFISRFHFKFIKRFLKNSF
ncbi:glycosyltransferase [Gillisia sp. JM1]|uniref:glycosyltransferase n=1 Tax=Gillisia sp. JM1 TaxID=1283286 RepID=UPI0003FD42B6|nr:glycosyltransferase [Gillisia sp. JM1]